MASSSRAAVIIARQRAGGAAGQNRQVYERVVQQGATIESNLVIHQTYYIGFVMAIVFEGDVENAIQKLMLIFSLVGVCVSFLTYCLNNRQMQKAHTIMNTENLNMFLNQASMVQQRKCFSLVHDINAITIVVFLNLLALGWFIPNKDPEDIREIVGLDLMGTLVLLSVYFWCAYEQSRTQDLVTVDADDAAVENVPNQLAINSQNGLGRFI